MWRIAGVIAGLMAGGCAPRLYTSEADRGGGSETDGAPAWVAPENGWPSAQPPAGLVGVGFAEGQVVLDVRGTDQHGDEVSLWQFWGQTVLLDISTMWCAPCQKLGMGTEAVYQHWKDRGFVYLTILHENDNNEAPTQEELEAWAKLPSVAPESTHELITAPIVADPQGRSGSIHAVRQNQYPVVLLIGPDMTVLDRVEPQEESRIEEVLAEHFGGR